MPEVQDILNKKVNRRDVLKGIGLGLAGLITSCTPGNTEVTQTEIPTPKEILNMKARIKDKEFKIVEQNGNPSYISYNQDELTNFFPPKEKNKDVTWLLAHNFINGDNIQNLKPKDPVVIIDQNGTETKYNIVGSLPFLVADGYDKSDMFAPLVLVNNEDLSPSYIDPITNKPGQYTTTELFNKLTALNPNKKTLILQTCIEKDGNYEAGRLFVIGYEE